MRLAMYAMQGVESALISIEKLSAAFCSEPADRTFHRIPSLWTRASSTHALGNILSSIGCSGSRVFLLLKFVDYFTNFISCENSASKDDSEVYEEKRPSYSLVNQAFAVAVGKVLEGYMCALDTLYASVGFRRISRNDGAPSSLVGCLTSVVHSEITLLELYLHTKDLRTQIEALANICNLHDVKLSLSVSSVEDSIAKAALEFRNFHRGGDLLTYLYKQLQVSLDIKFLVSIFFQLKMFIRSNFTCFIQWP